MSLGYVKENSFDMELYGIDKKDRCYEEIWISVVKQQKNRLIILKAPIKVLSYLVNMHRLD